MTTETNMETATQNPAPMTAVDYVNAEIERWTGKCHINCDRDTLCSTVGIVGGSLSALLSAASLTVRSAGVSMPLAVSIVIGVAGIVIGAAITICTQMAVKHAYAERWQRIRFAIEDLRHEVRCRLLGVDAYSGLTPDRADDLLMRRFKYLHDRAWGRSVSAPLPQVTA